MELIYIKDLSKAYGKTRVLDNLSVSYESGKIYGLVGENGAGKTTLFNCIMGVTDYDGEIRKSSNMAVGYMPAESFFYSLITGKEYLEFCVICRLKASSIPLSQERSILSSVLRQKGRRWMLKP